MVMRIEWECKRDRKSPLYASHVSKRLARVFREKSHVFACQIVYLLSYLSGTKNRFHNSFRFIITCNYFLLFLPVFAPVDPWWIKNTLNSPQPTLHTIFIPSCQISVIFTLRKHRQIVLRRVHIILLHGQVIVYSVAKRQILKYTLEFLQIIITTTHISFQSFNFSKHSGLQ